MRKSQNITIIIDDLANNQLFKGTLHECCKVFGFKVIGTGRNHIYRGVWHFKEHTFSFENYDRHLIIEYLVKLIFGFEQGLIVRVTVRGVMV
jgi:hypothetical protein